MKRIYVRELQPADFLKEKEGCKIGVFGLGPSSGTTFLALAMAQHLVEMNKSVGFLELSQGQEGKTLTYDCLAMDIRFSKSPYYKVYSNVQNNRQSKDRVNIDSGINWALICPDENMRSIKLTPLEEATLVNSVSCDYLLCDLGSNYLDHRFKLMDHILCVVDPMPGKLIANRINYRRLIQSDMKTTWVVNKFNPGVKSKFFFEYMKLGKASKIPLISEELFYLAQYNCRLPYEQKEIRDKLKPVIENLINRHILKV